VKRGGKGGRERKRKREAFFTEMGGGRRKKLFQKERTERSKVKRSFSLIEEGGKGAENHPQLERRGGEKGRIGR